ncbi:glutathione S-transferase family protein [Amycolatopsis anabasis]|uniref:glutathione S-transferase family protein n=1 Tax=Amycolatopsis anabasis TaxID=1840409 RepID=UPI00131D163E|nr:glutathione S-transferase C-terminal domain-containing protein [Amycolatopsis anabasis]
MSITPRAAEPVDIDKYGPYGRPPSKPPAEARKQTRPGPAFPNRIGTSEYPAEPGRYHLYAGHPCPFSQRVMIVRALKGLEEVLSVSILDPMRDSRGWALREGEGHGLDEVNGFAFLSEAYRASGFEGHYSTPVFWDRTANRIASNDFQHLDTDVATAFDAWATREIDLYPENLRGEIDELNEFLYEKVHNGPYKCGFAPTQEFYDTEVRSLFAALDELDARLADRRYLFGDRITLSDIRLWVTLVRFDAVYVTHFKANLRRIADYPNLWPYARDLYQIDAFRDTTNFDHIKRHYFGTHTWINPSRIVPVGPDLDWEAPHGRETK